METESVAGRGPGSPHQQTLSFHGQLASGSEIINLEDHIPLISEEIKEREAEKDINSLRRYERDILLQIRNSPLVVGALIELESEIFRDLHINSEAGMPADGMNERASEYLNVQDYGPGRREEGWRTAGQRQKPISAAIQSSPPHPSTIRSVLIDEGASSASPDRPIIIPHRQVGANWRRASDLRSEPDEDARRHAPGRGGVREDVERDRKLSSSAGGDDVWRPAGPPGLGRGVGRNAPPGLGAIGADPQDRPWGAGRGRLADGERRVTGKPRDPPGVMPPREQPRDPQLPEGWNRPRDRSAISDWRTGKGRDAGKNIPRDGNHGYRVERQSESRSDAPAWLTADDAEEFDALAPSADTKRLEFEAEHQKLRDEREAAKAAGRLVEEISLDEIEAMKQESLAEDQAARQKQKPPRPRSALGFESLFGDGLSQSGLMKELEGSAEARDEPGSRFTRFFTMEPSTSTSKLPDLSGNPSPVPQPAKQPSQPLPSSLPLASQPGALDTSQLQGFFAPRAPSATGSVSSDLPAPQRNLLAQLQAQGSGSLQQSAQQQGLGSQTSRSQLDRYLLDRNLLSPRGDQGAPAGGIPRPVSQQQFPAAANSSALLSLLQGQQGLTPQESVAGQLSNSMEPTFANPNPTQQQQQNLLNALNLGNQQQGGAQFSNNLLEQLQRMKLANEQQQKQQQLHQQFQLQPTQQGPSQANNLLAAFSAHMPRDGGAPKQLSDDLFSFNPNHQLQRISQAGLQQPASLGVGKNDRMGAQNFQSNNSLAHLLQNQQLSQARALSQQTPNNLTNGLYNLPQGNPPTQLANLRGLTGQNVGQGMGKLSQFSQVQGANQSVMGGSQPLGGADPQQIARYLEQQRQTQMLQQQFQQHQQQQAQHARLINTQRLYQLQIAQQQAQQQQRAAQAALLQQQQQQQQLQQQSRMSNEALLRQQQLLQLQNLQTLQQLQQQGPGSTQTSTNLMNSAADPNALARLFASSGAGGLNNLPGRGQ